MEKREPSCTVGGKVNWCSHCGKQYEVKWNHSVVSDSLWPHGLCSPPGPSVHGIFQARILEWVAISFSGKQYGGSSKKLKICVCRSNLPIYLFPPPFTPHNRKFIFYISNSILVFKNMYVFKSSCVAFFQFPRVRDIMWYSSFSTWLTSLSMRFSRSIHVAANGIYMK